MSAAPAPLPPLPWAPGGSGYDGRLRRRKLVSTLVMVSAFACVIIALVPLGSILWTAIDEGGRLLSWNFVAGPEATSPCDLGTAGCQVGGIGPAVEGTLLLMGMAAAWAIPVSIVAAIYLSEFSQGKRLSMQVGGRKLSFGGWEIARLVSFMVDVLSGVPSIVVGVFVWTLFCFYDPQFLASSYTQAVALGVIMIPIVTRTAEDALRTVPLTLREAAWGLGISRRKTVSKVVLRSGLGPILTGSLLAVTRAGGETAPLLIIGTQPDFFPLHNCPPAPVAHCFANTFAALGPLIYFNGEGAYTNEIAASWGAALVFIILMLGLSLAARLALRGRLVTAGMGG